MSDDLIADAMLPSVECLVKLHRRLDPSGTSLLSVEQLVVNLQEAYKAAEKRETALGRALGVLRRCWNGGAWGTVFDYMVEKGAEKPVNWPDVVRWVSDEQKEETVDEKTPQATDGPQARRVMEVARPDELAAAGVDPALARWRGFSDEELAALRRAISRAALSETDPLSNEISEVQHRREAEQSSYRGPGRYMTSGGRCMDVLGTGGDPAVMGERTQVVLRDSGDRSGILMHENLAGFNELDRHGRRAFEYLGPLED